MQPLTARMYTVIIQIQRDSCAVCNVQYKHKQDTRESYVHFQEREYAQVIVLVNTSKCIIATIMSRTLCVAYIMCRVHYVRVLELVDHCNIDKLTQLFI